MTDAALTAAVDAARAALAQEPHAELALVHRRRIWLALGPLRREGARALPGPGWAARCALADACARRVRHVGDGTFAAPIIERALAASTQYRAGGSSYDEAETRRGELWSDCEQLIAGDPEALANSAAFAAVCALSTALHDEPLDPASFDEALTDDGLDPWSWDAALYASAAEAGFAWQPGSDPDRRRAYWSWFLDEALRVGDGADRGPRT